MKCEQLIEILERQAAERYACDWDNVGLLIGNRQKDVHTVYIALDATDAAVEEAVEAGADLILTHHPMIFKGMKRVTEEDFIGRRIIRLIKNDISYYAMHTNFDVKGMADLAAGVLQLEQAEPLEVTCVEQGIAQGIGRVGMLHRECTLEECADLVKKAFGLSYVSVFGDRKQRVRKAAICPGSGKGTMQEAIRAKADVYITGDIDHHTGIDANAQGLAVIDAGHYGIEHIFVPYMKKYLRSQAPELAVVAQSDAEPFVII